LATYFLCYRYLEPRYSDVVDGNTVVHLSGTIQDESDIRSLETSIADGLGVNASALGLTNLVRLDD
jgi:hypothetical protein